MNLCQMLNNFKRGWLLWNAIVLGLINMTTSYKFICIMLLECPYDVHYQIISILCTDFHPFFITPIEIMLKREMVAMECHCPQLGNHGNQCYIEFILLLECLYKVYLVTTVHFMYRFPSILYTNKSNVKK